MPGQNQDPCRARTVAEAVRAAASRLLDAGLEDAEPLSRQAIAFLLQCSVPDLHRRAADAWPEALDAGLADVESRFIEHEPPAYVFGSADFRGHVLAVDPRVLVPRPETEQLVQAVLDDALLWKSDQVRIADVCTGSGCIAVSLALEQSRARLLAIDISADALEVARSNVVAHGLEGRVTLCRASWLEGQPPESLDAVVSNPPYVTEQEWKELAPRVREHEPRLALAGGADGLDSYRALAPQSFRTLVSGGRVFFEIGASQGVSVSALVADAGFSDVRCWQDYQRRDRWVTATKP